MQVLFFALGFIAYAKFIKLSTVDEVYTGLAAWAVGWLIMDVIWYVGKLVWKTPV